MQEMHYTDLQSRASMAAELDITRLAEAHSRVDKVIKEMQSEGKALVLTSEEENMLHSFRRFKLRMRKDGEVFKWQSRRSTEIQLVEDTAEILHPQEV